MAFQWRYVVDLQIEEAEKSGIRVTVLSPKWFNLIFHEKSHICQLWEVLNFNPQRKD